MHATPLKRAARTSLLFICSALAFWTGAQGFGPAGAQAADKVSVRLSWFANGEEAYWAYGLKKGFFAAEGIELEIKEGNGSANTLRAVAADESRFGSAGAYAMAGLIAKGLPVTMIANMVPVIPSSILYFEGTDIKSPKDLEGKSIAFTAGDINHVTFKALIERNGVDVSKIKDVYFDPRGKVAAFMKGDVNALAGFYTFSVPTIEAQQPKKVRYMRYVDYGVRILGEGIIINNKYLGDNDLNCRFVRAAAKARTEATADPDGAIAALLEQYPKAGDSNVQKAVWQGISSLERSSAAASHPLGYIAEEDWKVLLEVLKTYGGESDILKPSVYYTNKFVGCS